MKRKFIFLAMLLLTLIGGVKWNVLNAQDDVITIGGDATKESSVFPIPTYYGQSLSQTLYTASAINHAPATITSIAFKKNSDDAVRNLTVYLKNTDKETLSGWVEFSDTDKVYANASLTTSSVDGWMTLELDKEFEYTGGGIIVIAWDRTGSTTYKSGCMYTDIGSNIALYNTNSTLTEDNYLTYSPSVSTRQPSIKFGFQNITDDLEPATPTGLAATVNDHKSISLSWNVAENAKGYKVYQDGEQIAITGGTSYNVDGLEQSTAYCFTVTAIRGAKESAASEEVCATTEAFDGCFVDFLLSDSYGDGWTGCSINLTFSNGDTKSLTITNGGKAEPVPFTLAIPKGLVTITFTSVSYPGECSYVAKYTDGDVIYTSGVGVNLETSFTVDCGEAVVPDIPTNLATESVTYNSVTLTWEPAANAKKYYIYQDGEYLNETYDLYYTINNLSDDTEYCFTVKSVYNSSYVSEESEPFCTRTIALPVPATPTNLAVTSVTHNSVTLTWDAVQYAESYTVSYGTIENTVTGNTCNVTGLTPETSYTFSVKANNIKGSSTAAEVSATTIEDPFAGKQFRVKVANGSYEGQYLKVLSHDQPITPSYYYADAATRVGISGFEQNNLQIFTITDNGSGQYYLCDADGYFIKCDDQSNYNGRNTWDIDAYSTTIGTPLIFEYIDQQQFYIRDYDKIQGNGSTSNHSTTNNYFKVENSKVYCDAPINYSNKESSYVAKWTLEEVVMIVALYADNVNIYDNESTTLYANPMFASGDCTYSWTLNGEVVGNDATYTFTPSTIGEYTFTCTVTDSKNATATKDITINVSTRPALTLSIDAEIELIYNDGETTTLTANATEGYAPYTYSWTINGEVVGTDVSYTFSNETVGEYALTCTVTDSRNNTVTASKTITVKDESERPLEIVLGKDDGNAKDYDGYFPTNPYYNYSLTQQIYTKAEIGKQENVIITSIAFKESAGYTTIRNLDIYMQNTSETTCNENSFPMNVGNICYSGEVEFIPNDWTIITLDTPFEYDATKNILLCIDDNTGTYIGGRSFVTYSTVSEKSYRIYNDNTNFDPSGNVYSNELVNYKNHIKLGYELPNIKPQNLQVENDYNIVEANTSFELTWDVLEGATAYKIYKYNYLNEAIGTPIIITENHYDAIEIEHNMNGIYYGVSAIINEVETEQAYTHLIQVIGHGNINGVVTYGETKVADITIKLSGTTALSGEDGVDEYYIETNKSGEFNIDVLVGTYTLTISHEDYEEVEYPNIIVTYNEDIKIDIQLTDKPATFEGTVSTDWNTAANWSRNEVPEGADVIINANAVISSDADVNVKNLNIKSGSLTIEGILAVTGTITNNGNLIINDGAQLFQNNEDINATFNMSIISPDTDNWESNNKEGWQFISSPFLDATVASFIPSEGEYDLYKYDGTQDLEWVNHKGGNSDEPGTDADTEFFFDFNDGSMEGLRVFQGEGNGEENKSANWQVTANGDPYYIGYDNTKGIYSYSWNLDDNEYNYPYNYVVTTQAYSITSASVLSWDMRYTYNGGAENDKYQVVASTDGVDFDVVVWEGTAADANENTISLAEYAGQTLYLGFYHYTIDQPGDAIVLDNIRLSSGSRIQTRGTSSFEDKFAQGVGYLASYEIAATVALNGELNPKTNKTWGQYYYNAEKDLANLRLLGNPFTFNMDMSKLSSYGMATGYAVVNENGEYEYKTDGIVNVGDGFFVKVAADYATLTYDHSYVAPVLRGSEKANSINVIASGKAGKDNVVVNFAGQAEGFNKLQNFNDAIATVYVTENGKNYGIANVDENTTEVALNFDAKEMGSYTISLDVNGEFETVTLVDRFTGIETNMLLEDEYNFTATSNDSHNRFVIRLANGQEPTANSQFVYQSGEELILSIEGSVQIVDMLGRVVYYNEHANGDNRINVAEFNDAAYVVRVVNEEGVKVQKVVIY